MQGQEKLSNPRLIGYGIGIAAFIAAVLWKLLVR